MFFHEVLKITGFFTANYFFSTHDLYSYCFFIVELYLALYHDINCLENWSFIFWIGKSYIHLKICIQKSKKIFGFSLDEACLQSWAESFHICSSHSIISMTNLNSQLLEQTWMQPLLGRGLSFFKVLSQF